MRLVLIGIIVFPLLSGCSLFGINRVEEASYQVLRSDENFELREYQPLVVAETYYDGEFDKAGNQAFQRLFDYISCENTSASNISMTAPVLIELQNQQWRYMFVLPSNYTYETAPIPNQANVKLAVMPQKKVAVIRFAGIVDRPLIQQKTTRLNQWLMDNNLTASSSPRWAQYNPPWTLPFLRRNEVMIDVN
jgi:effector-binding domain-containing protein